MTTTNLAMTLPTVGASDDTWGTTLNANLALIDAFAGKVPLLLDSGVVSSLGDLDITLPSGYTAYRLVLTDVTSGASKLFARFNVGGVQTTGYEYVRTDLNVSGPTQTLASGNGDAAIVLSDSMLSQGTDTDNAGHFIIDIANKATVTKGRISLCSRGTYDKAAGAGRTKSETGGALVGMSARSTALKIGGWNGASDFAVGIRCSWALSAIPGLA